MDIKEYFSNKNRNDYQRDYFDSFLKKTSFKYNVPSIHIAGTNGKGSTATYIASSYIANGYKVGLFVSPYFVEPNEQISINGKQITDDEMFAIIKEYEKLIDKYDLSAFEIQTFIAFKYFQDNKCDIAVIECGMGGETDATNIFDSVLSIVTSVSLEHTSFLGKSISEIAANKLGIMRSEVPLLLGSKDEDVVSVASEYAHDLDTKIISPVEPSNVTYSEQGHSFTYSSFKDVKIKSLARYSVKDACLALEALLILKDQFPFDDQKVKEGMANVVMPGRMSVESSNPLIIVDGGHNPEAIQSLVASLANPVGNRAIHIVFAAFRDKNIERMLAELGTISSDIVLTTFDHPRARSEEEYFLFLGDYRFEENAVEAIKKLKEEYPNDAIIITGSLAFAGYIHNLFMKGGI